MSVFAFERQRSNSSRSNSNSSSSSSSSCYWKMRRMRFLFGTLLWTVRLGSTNAAEDCSCVEGFKYFPELRLGPNETLPPAGYCRYRPGTDCTYLWEDLERSNMQIYLHECYANDDPRCSDSIAIFYRAVFLNKEDAREDSAGVTNTTQLTCRGSIQEAIDLVYYYCGGQQVCFDEVGMTRAFDDLHPEWKRWLEVSLGCSAASAHRHGLIALLLPAFLFLFCAFYSG